MSPAVMWSDAQSVAANCGSVANVNDLMSRNRIPNRREAVQPGVKPDGTARPQVNVKALNNVPRIPKHSTDSLQSPKAKLVA